MALMDYLLACEAEMIGSKHQRKAYTMTMSGRSLNLRRETEGEDGFTLIELLIVIVILGVLAAVVTVSVLGLTNKSGLSACQTDAKQVETAITTYNQLNAPGIVEQTPIGLGPNNYYVDRYFVDLLVQTDANPNGVLKSWPKNFDQYYIGINPTSLAVDIYPGSQKANQQGTSAIPFEPALTGGLDGCQQLFAN